MQISALSTLCQLLTATPKQSLKLDQSHNLNIVERLLAVAGCPAYTLISPPKEDLRVSFAGPSSGSTNAADSAIKLPYGFSAGVSSALAGAVTSAEQGSRQSAALRALVQYSTALQLVGLSQLTAPTCEERSKLSPESEVVVSLPLNLAARSTSTASRCSLGSHAGHAGAVHVEDRCVIEWLLTLVSDRSISISSRTDAMLLIAAALQLQAEPSIDAVSGQSILWPGQQKRQQKMIEAFKMLGGLKVLVQSLAELVPQPAMGGGAEHTSSAATFSDLARSLPAVAGAMPTAAQPCSEDARVGFVMAAVRCLRGALSALAASKPSSHKIQASQSVWLHFVMLEGMLRIA